MLKDQIGVGKYSKVYKALHARTGKTVAVKVVNKKGVTEVEKNMIRNEVGIAKILQHPNIMCFHSVMESSARVYLVSELIPGKDLQQHMASRKRLSEYQAANIAYYLLCAVQYMHDSGVVHRDLKPENIMIELTEDGQDILTAKIIDFGLSMTLLPNKLILEQCGTLVYIAPEVFLKYGYSKEVDVWSVGIILHYMLTGKLPYGGAGKTRENGVGEKELKETSAEGSVECECSEGLAGEAAGK